MRHLPVAEVYVARNEVLTVGGPPVWEAFMDEPREIHLGPQARMAPAPQGPTVGAQMEAAYLAVMARAADSPATSPG
jgi:hypothetical protein